MRNGWYAVLVAGGMAAVLTPAIVLASNAHVFDGRRGFDAVVNGIEIRYHAHATKIPFMGLISGIAGHYTHGGVRNMHVAEFENLTEPVDGAELTALVEQRAGDGWQRMVRETSREGHEQSLIYARPEGDHMGMLVVDLDGKELDVVQLSMNPDQLAKEITRRGHSHAEDSGENDKDDRREKGEPE
jgi:hypothetical protein